METPIYIEYKMIFSDKPLDICEYLRNIDRHNLICTALRLIYSDNMYSEYKDYCAEFFCAENFSFANDCFKLLSNYLQESNQNLTATYIVISQSTALELLRQTFAINRNDFVANIPQSLQEQYLFKALLIINQTIAQWEVPMEYNSEGDVTDLCLAKYIFCSSLDNFERVNIRPEYVAMLQIIKGYHFLNYCENSKFKTHLNVFLTNYGFKNWQQYLYEAIHLILYPLINKKGYFPVISLNSQRDGEKFLQALSFEEKNSIPLDKNMDYTYFKTYPLIKIGNGSYLPISTLFCINRIYKSIYFEFKAINNTFINTHNYINDKALLPIITSEFSEQTLFEKYIRNTLSGHHGLKLSDTDCKRIRKSSHEPDFYLRDGNNIILFENKDIKIPDKVFSHKKYDLLEDIIRKKLIDKQGIGQLVYNIKQIEEKTFKWDSRIPNNPRIYPILIIDDSSLCVPGLNYILNEELQQQIRINKINIKVYPLVIIELDTLIAFANYFQSRTIKFKEILDKYYKYISICNNPKQIEQLDYKYYPFYFFMSKKITNEPFNNTIFNEILDKLKKSLNIQE